MACDFEYCVYDPAVTKTAIPYSNKIHVQLLLEDELLGENDNQNYR